MAGRVKVVVVGSANIDLVAYASRVPRAGETLVGDRFSTGFGGKGANQAVMARLLGADVAMIGCIGDDAYGDMTIENFESYGVDTSNVHRTTGSSGVAHIWVEPDGTNRIIVVPGANSLLTSGQAASAAQEVSRGAVLVGQLEIPQDVTRAAFAAARDEGAVTILNPAPASTLDRELIALSTWLVFREPDPEPPVP
jgi:ribokinase